MISNQHSTYGKYVKNGRNVWRNRAEAPSIHPDLAQNNQSTLNPTLRPCPNEIGCGSCSSLTLSYEDLLEKKFNTQLAHLTSEISANTLAPAEVHSSPKQFNYRTLAKLVVIPAPKTAYSDIGPSIKLAMYEKGSHKTHPVGNCKLHKQNINSLIRSIEWLASDLKIEPYNEQTKTGSFRYVVIRTAHLTDDVMITFVRADENSDKPYKDLYTQLRQKSFKIAGCFLDTNTSVGNAIFSGNLKKLGGVGYLRERLCDVDFFIGPTSFFQINPWQAERIYRRIAQICGRSESSENIVDLYCGVGQIGAVVAKQGFDVLGLEENPEAIELAKKCFGFNNLSGQFTAGRIEDQSFMIKHFGKNCKYITINPSRRGMDPAAIESVTSLARKNNARILYLSCDYQSLTRDLKRFSELGIKLSQAEAFDMFPYTDQLEWLCVLDTAALA